jgi:hypothetical protein
MTMAPIVRARLLGGVVVLVAFAAGVLTGVAIGRRPREGVTVTVMATKTTALPRELERLGLTDAQRVQIGTILDRGRERVFAVVRDFDPRMRLAMDSTNAEIDAVLTAAQRASWAEYRKQHPGYFDERVIRKAKPNGANR